MILAYAGRRAASLGGDADDVADRIRRVVGELNPSAVVGAAADGADLLVLETVLAMADRPTVHVVLPTAREVFAEDSVDPAWRGRFEAVLDEVAQHGGTVRTLDLDPGEAAYRAANQAFLDSASGLAPDGEVAVLVIGHAGEGQMIEDLLDRARLAGVPCLRLDPDDPPS